MSCKFAELLPQYAAGTLDEASSRAVAGHLDSCLECREELALWRQVGAAIRAAHAADPMPSPALVGRALTRVRRARPSLAARAWALLVAQVPLVRREIWPASALVMAIGTLVAALLGDQRGWTVVQALAPIVAAAGLLGAGPRVVAVHRHGKRGERGLPPMVGARAGERPRRGPEYSRAGPGRSPASLRPGLAQPSPALRAGGGPRPCRGVVGRPAGAPHSHEGVSRRPARSHLALAYPSPDLFPPRGSRRTGCSSLWGSRHGG